MKKWIAVIVLATIGTFVVADLAKSDSDTSSKTEAPSTTTTEVPSTTTTTDNTVERRGACVVAVNHVADGLDAIADGAKLLPYVSNAAAREFLATANDFVDTSIETVQLCAEFSPTEASYTRDALRELKALLNQAEAMY